MKKIHVYESTPGVLSFRMVKDPHKHKEGDIIKILKDDGAYDSYIVCAGSGCPDCDCFESDTCPRWESGTEQKCILDYGYTHKNQKLSLKSIDKIVEEL